MLTSLKWQSVGRKKLLRRNYLIRKNNMDNKKLQKAGGPSPKELKQVEGLGAEEVMRIAREGAEYEMSKFNN